jgi:hypothetical protein
MLTFAELQGAALIRELLGGSIADNRQVSLVSSLRVVSQVREEGCFSDCPDEARHIATLSCPLEPIRKFGVGLCGTRMDSFLQGSRTPTARLAELTPTAYATKTAK